MRVACFWNWFLLVPVFEILCNIWWFNVLWNAIQAWTCFFKICFFCDLFACFLFYSVFLWNGFWACFTVELLVFGLFFQIYCVLACAESRVTVDYAKKLPHSSACERYERKWLAISATFDSSEWSFNGTASLLVATPSVPSRLHDGAFIWAQQRQKFYFRDFCRSEKLQLLSGDWT